MSQTELQSRLIRCDLVKQLHQELLLLGKKKKKFCQEEDMYLLPLIARPGEHQPAKQNYSELCANSVC